MKLVRNAFWLLILLVFMLAIAPYKILAEQTNGNNVEPATIGGTNGSASLTLPTNGGTGLGSGGTVSSADQQQAAQTPCGTNCNLTYTPLEPLPGFTSLPQNGDIGPYLSAVFKIIMVIGGLVAVASLVFGGIAYMVSEVVDKKTAARRRIVSAFWGLILLIGSYVILFTINPQLVNLTTIFNPTAGLTGGGGSSGANGSSQSLQPTAAQINQCTSQQGCRILQDGTCSC